MSPDSGNIRVFVRFEDDPIVYSGEELKCTIAFKNVAQAAPTSAGGSTSNQHQLKPPIHQNHATNAYASSRLAPPPSASSSAPRRGHRSSSSMSLPSKTSRSREGSIPWLPPSHPPDNHPGNGHSHARSVSVVSIGSVNSVDSQATSNAGSTVSRPARGHGRSASVQILSRGSPMSGPRHGG